ncbi:MAG TPA: hypothetical protein DEG17_25020 [Cyanobacteria bacterium UBA11149]|nr:hypothetical protein [Cyanobacteria bacterium UBA11367]HBE57562.1 hypothetical protein [Cyanobacteria bacterium UBA11366]HBK64314.1 hypothetical protein [Cyanobacteria bacterium UBA11166]HBR73290.1 hypothetical protein [Cyanobacteria bacterium UBA11159]HBS67762.1 hypothetical protein [Cyanobacteria bacterium UBA11153]HBW92041.1 hypothetical protein [Cyanobacteria bacterium UBA11149]HCA97959.1 hypothetical protein [Cyanobacteria bacterium UBA9226]
MVAGWLVVGFWLLIILLYRYQGAERSQTASLPPALQRLRMKQFEDAGILKKLRMGNIPIPFWHKIWFI